MPPKSADRILDILRRAKGPVPGPEIARLTGISRAAVWKAIRSLAGRGYRIARHNPGGYRLEETPDRLFAAEIEPRLRTRSIGRIVHHFESIDSTQRRAMELGREGAPEGTVVIAETQTKGRGRLGRTFFSPPGTSLYVSILLRPAIPPAGAPQITLVAGIAVAETVERHAGRRPALKWPNDVLLGGRKIAGILTEMESETDRVLFVVCGPGVNLNVPEGAFPPELRDIATSILAETGRTVDRAQFAADLFGAFERCYDEFQEYGFARLRDRWEAYSALVGKTIRVEGGAGALEGTAVGLDDDGALRVETRAGTVARIIAGDVTLSRQERS